MYCQELCLKVCSWNLDCTESAGGFSDDADYSYTMEKKKLDIYSVLEYACCDLLFLQEGPEELLLSDDDWQCKLKGKGLSGALWICISRVRDVDILSVAVESGVMVVTVRFEGRLVVLVNAHLDAGIGKERQRWKKVYRVIRYLNAFVKDEVVIFGGDLNMRENEFHEVLRNMSVLSAVVGFVDGMESKRKEEYTWDMVKNKYFKNVNGQANFDRIIVGKNEVTEFTILANGILLDNELTRREFNISDHYLIYCVFKVS